MSAPHGAGAQGRSSGRRDQARTVLSRTESMRRDGPPLAGTAGATVEGVACVRARRAFECLGLPLPQVRWTNIATRPSGFAGLRLPLFDLQEHAVPVRRRRRVPVELTAFHHDSRWSVPEPKSERL